DDFARVALSVAAGGAALRERYLAIERVAVGRAGQRVGLVARVAEPDLRAADLDLTAEDRRGLAVLLEETLVLVDLRVEALDAVGITRDALRGSFLDHPAEPVHDGLELVDLLRRLREL